MIVGREEGRAENWRRGKRGENGVLDSLLEC
jgi:hypothetical protein